MTSDHHGTMYVQDGWLDSDTATSATLTIGGTYTPSSTGDWWYTPTYPAIYHTWPTYSERKIRLTLSEVEHLRKAARKDAKLRETLRKFSPHIEVEVDFPG